MLQGNLPINLQDPAVTGYKMLTGEYMPYEKDDFSSYAAKFGLEFLGINVTDYDNKYMDANVMKVFRAADKYAKINTLKPTKADVEAAAEGNALARRKILLYETETDWEKQVRKRMFQNLLGDKVLNLIGRHLDEEEKLRRMRKLAKEYEDLGSKSRIHALIREAQAESTVWAINGFVRGKEAERKAWLRKIKAKEKRNEARRYSF